MDQTIISSRRAFDFRLDSLRLTLLSSANVMGYLREILNASGSQLTTPPPLFEAVPESFPPGIVIHTGSVVIEDEAAIPLRWFCVDSRKIVVDVAGPSESAERVFSAVREGLSTLRRPDGDPAIGEPAGRRDWSQIRWPDGSLDLDQLINPRVLELLREQFAEYVNGGQRMSVPSLRLNMPLASEGYPGAAVTDVDSFYIDLRFDSTSDDKAITSAAPLSSDEHIALMERLSQAVAK